MVDRPANVARTPHGDENVNRLRRPEWGILRLYLKAGRKSSKSHRPEGGPTVDPADEGGTNEFNFLPEKDEVHIIYEVDNPYGVIDGGKLELFTRFNKDALWSLDLKQLGKTWWTHGKHTVKWDGRVVKGDAELNGTEEDGGVGHDLTSLDPDKTTNGDEFPDGYTNLKHTPYKAKLTLTSSLATGNPATAWTYYHILLEEMKLELGPEEAVPAVVVDDAKHKRDKAVRKKIEDDGGIPADGSTYEVKLISNIYKTASGQMNDNTAFTEHSTMWEKGSNIPIFAKIRLKDAAGNTVKVDEEDKGAVALGKAQFLWDWEDKDEDVDGQQGQAKPKALIKNAINYFKEGTDANRSDHDHTYPKGDNCHVDRGGKRGPGAEAVFPDQAGYDPKDTLDAGKFPFKVVAGSGRDEARPKVRKWGAYSLGWTKGKLKGQTGVVFQPSRMAGDDYQITVYLAYDKKLDTADSKVKVVLDVKDESLKAPAKIKKSTGKFQIWREIHLVRYIRKKGTIAAYLPTNLGAVQAKYNEAYVHVEDKMEAGDQYLWAEHRNADDSTPDYNVACRAKIAAAGDALLNLAVDATADHASEDSAFLVRTYEEFVKEVHRDLHAGVAGAANDFTGLDTPKIESLGRKNDVTIGAWTATVAQRDRLVATRNKLRTNNVKTKKTYVKPFLDDKLMLVVKAMMKEDLKLISGKKAGAATAGAREGITIIHFNYTNTYLRTLRAAGVGSGSKLGSAVPVNDADRNKCVFLFLKPALDTFVHEIGHHLFLPHAPWKKNDQPMAGQPDRHDDTDKNCMMSYNRPRDAFCGLCQLRVRGWSADALNKTSATNKKP